MEWGGIGVNVFEGKPMRLDGLKSFYLNISMCIHKNTRRYPKTQNKTYIKI